MTKKTAQKILDRLTAPGELGGQSLPKDFVMPAYDGFSLANIPVTVLEHFGVKGPGTLPLDPEVIGDRLKGSRKVVVLLLDALGYLPLIRQMGIDRGLGLNDLARRGRFVPLTSVFPSQTSVTLMSLATGLLPSGHGVTGYRMYLPDRGVVANMIRLSPDSDERPNRLMLDDPGGKSLLRAPTVHERLTRAGIASYCFIQDPIYGSGLSQILYRGATGTMPFINSSDMFVQIRKLVETDPETPACIWAYWGALDTIQHAYGTWVEESAAEVRNIAFSLQKELLDPLRRSKTSGATLILTSDHGHIQVKQEDVILTSRLGRLKGAMVAPPTGTGRSVYLHLKDGSVPDVLKYLRKTLADRAVVIESSVALSEGLWGRGRPMPEMPGRIGDLTLLMRDSCVLFYPYTKKFKPTGVTGGRHGALHREEMLIPFFCAKM